MVNIADDASEPSSQKAAFLFFNKCVVCWGREHDQNGLPGLNQFIYERIIPLAFRVPSSSRLHLKDGQVIVVSVKRNSMAFLWLIVVHPQTDFYTKFVTSFKRSSRREAKKRSIFISLFFSPHKIGHLRRLWNVYRWCGIRIPKYFTELIRPSRHASWMWSFLDSLLLSHLVSLLSALCCVCVWDSWQKILAN